jgi:hypothetical protein
MYGIDFNMENGEDILKINSPRSLVDGPYTVVFKDMEERWVIVALCWDNKPNLAIRWFWDNNGNPQSHGYATWLIIPSMLQNAVLNGLPLDFLFRDRLNYFLTGEIIGNQLKKGE